ncbi:hypothetical protein B9G69_002275 [Bdellovibrio sp. SKB1291214]|uniref:hypothetical protein n=1 Tax=Bdellovibrio sp. SKB1291214 TaxID=1732569 RepID=UPI000B51BD2E|nr:hypothetical protein [Bdellovibrio sp. SKB1291214]UYL09398.1 hypothetical protein B9G69_002275 [Bdellovibrio sp. SKB1291214]
MKIVILLSIILGVSMANAADSGEHTANTNPPTARENTTTNEGTGMERKDPSSSAFKKHRGDASRSKQTKAKSSSTEEPVSPSQTK